MSERPVHELIKELSGVLVQLSDKVLQNFFLSLKALKHHDVESARQIKMVDEEIDKAEVDLEERCLAFLALQQPLHTHLLSSSSQMKACLVWFTTEFLGGNLSSKGLGTKAW